MKDNNILGSQLDIRVITIHPKVMPLYLTNLRFNDSLFSSHGFSVCLTLLSL